MSYYGWIFITSCFGTVSLQYIHSGGPEPNSLLYPLDPNNAHQVPLPYVNYFNSPATRDYGGFMLPNTEAHANFYPREDVDQTDLQRNRRTAAESNDDRPWQPNLVDQDKTAYLNVDDKHSSASPFLEEDNANTTKLDLIETLEKRNFSPWGGKRDGAPVQHAWTWKRSVNNRDASMPKRVRFSPWGGKRSGQILYKAGMKGSKIIFSTTVPEVTRTVSYSPNEARLNIAGFQFIPNRGKRHPIEILALTSKVNGEGLREALPFKTFLENLPKIFKPGHTYSDVNLKKDGKRKLKFSAWGGKRAPPMIGPIWTPQDMDQSILKAFLLIRERQQDHMGQKTV